MTTATDLCTQAAARFKDPDNRVISASQWLQYLNQAYKKANTSSPLLPWLVSAEETVSVIAGARSGALPSNVFNVNWVYDVTNDRPLKNVDEVGAQWMTLGRLDTGPPQFYRVRNGNIEVFPLPEAATSLRAECIEYPAALSALTYTKTSAAGAAAGAVTVTGVAVGDSLVYVLKVVEANPPTVTDLTSEFTVTGTNTINNTGGTSSAGETLAVGYTRQSGTGSPVYPATFHEDLLDGMLALAYIDDGSPEQYKGYQQAFDKAVARMNLDILSHQAQRQPGVNDTFFQ